MSNHLQLRVIQTTFSGREKLPAQHLSKLRPSGCRTVGKEHDVLKKQTHIYTKLISTTKLQNALCCVSVTGISHLGVLTDHVEPEDRCPGTLLLAGVGDDDHWEGGGLGCVPGKKNFFLFRSYFNHRNNKHFLYRTHLCASHITRKVAKETPPATQQTSLYAEIQCQSRWCAAPLWHWEKSVKTKTHTSTHRSLFGCSHHLGWWTTELNCKHTQTVSQLTSLAPFPPPPDFCSFRLCRQIIVHKISQTTIWYNERGKEQNVIWKWC